MSLYPIPRQTRESDIIAGDGRATYGPFGFRIFDVEDVVAEVSRKGKDRTLEVVAAMKVAGQPFDNFTVTFSPPLSSGDTAIVASARLHERSVDVFRGGALSSVSLELELSKQGSVLQELRRDVGRRILPGGDAPGGGAGNGYSKPEVDALLAGKAASQHTHVIGDVAGLSNALAGKQDSLPSTPEFAANKGQANGYPSLDSGGKVPASQLPDVSGGLSVANIGNGHAILSGITNNVARLRSLKVTSGLSIAYGQQGTVDEGSIILTGNGSGSGASSQDAVYLNDGAAAGLSDYYTVAQANLSKAVAEGREFRVPPGDWPLSQRLTASGGPLTIRGVGAQQCRLVWLAGASSSGISYDSDVDRFGVVIEDVSLITQQKNAGIALACDYQGQVNMYGMTTEGYIQDRFAPRIHAHRVIIRGHTSDPEASGWNRGIHLTNPFQVYIVRCTIVGASSGGDQSPVSSHGIYMGTTNGLIGYPCEAFVFNCAIYRCNVGIEFEQMEGCWATHNNLVSVNTGVFYNNDTTRGRPQFVCKDNHVNAMEIGVRAYNSYQFTISGNLIFKHIRSNNVTSGILVHGPRSENGIIFDNVFQNTDSSGAQSRLDSIYIAEGRRISIFGNSYKAFAANAPISAVWLGSSSIDCRIGQNEVYGEAADIGLSWTIRDEGQNNRWLGIGCRQSLGSPQSVSGSQTALSFTGIQTEAIGNAASQGNRPDPTVFRCPFDGVYQFTAASRILISGGGNFALYMRKNSISAGMVVSQTSFSDANGNGGTVHVCSPLMYCRAGDEIRLFASATGSGPYVDNGPQTWFDWRWMGV